MGEMAVGYLERMHEHVVAIRGRLGPKTSMVRLLIPYFLYLVMLCSATRINKVR
jgi:hypothetical protein